MIQYPRIPQEMIDKMSELTKDELEKLFDQLEERIVVMKESLRSHKQEVGDMVVKMESYQPFQERIETLEQELGVVDELLYKKIHE